MKDMRDHPLQAPPEELFGVEPGALERLRARLGEEAGSSGELDVAYRLLDSPLGPLLVASTERGVVRLGYACEGFDGVLQGLADAVGPRVLQSPSRLDEAARQLEEYFEGRRRTFGLPLDRRLSTGFRGEVQRYLPSIAYGSTVSYGRIAAALGRPRAVRAVGTACAANPLPVIVPCHRVLRADGSLGGYVGGTEAKRSLLALEHEGEGP
jgi:methylated-DNA-[protein]-cysteine S-methyltransferase